jgi:heme exporter protein C
MDRSKILRNSWKFAGVILLLYAIIAGFIIPLKPGITDLDPGKCFTGQEITLSVKTYNGHWDQIKEGINARAWLKLKPDYAIESNSIEILGRNYLTINFVIPATLPDNREFAETSLILDNIIDGPSVFPTALFIRQDTVNKQTYESVQWSKAQELIFHTKTNLAFPFRNILVETIRNLFFHVSLWFAMFILFVVSVIYSIQYLLKNKPQKDNIASSFALVGVIYGLLGTATGSIWAKYTWGTFWTTDVKLNMTAVLILIYLAYFMLRSSIADLDQKRKLASVYNIFAFCMIIPLIFVIPRLTDSLHPGNGGNPGLGGEDLDNTLRMVFYPAVIGFTLLGTWMASLWSRFKNVEEQMFMKATKKPDINLFESKK